MDIVDGLERAGAPEGLICDIQLVLSMYPNDIAVQMNPEGGRGEEDDVIVRLHCRPHTSGETQRELVFYKCELRFQLRDGTIKSVRVLSSRGIDDSHLAAIEEVAMKSGASSNPVFELLEFVTGTLTEMNEAGECSICLSPLSDLTDDDVPCRGPCFHRYHLSCIVEWCAHQKGKESRFRCPVCREILDDCSIIGLEARVAKLKVDDTDALACFNRPIPVRVLDLTK